MSEWQPIETAPKETGILVINERGIFVASWHEDGPDNCVDAFWHVTNGKYWMDLRGQLPTRWMPLPDPPAQSPAPSSPLSLPAGTQKEKRR